MCSVSAFRSGLAQVPGAGRCLYLTEDPQWVRRAPPCAVDVGQRILLCSERGDHSSSEQRRDPWAPRPAGCGCQGLSLLP